jgi:tRNA nucleotidyltransferase/poly(A) polymerase
MKGASTVEVKDKCKLGKLNGKSAACNQGDISNLTIKSIVNEEIDASDAYDLNGSLNTLINGKREVGLIVDMNRDIIKKLNDNNINVLPIQRGDQKSYIIYTNKEKALRLRDIMNSHGGYASDKSPEEAREIGEIFGYSKKSIDDFIKKHYNNVPVDTRTADDFNHLDEAEIYSLDQIPFTAEIEKLGGKIYSVGGAVRDKYLGKESKDLDIMITGVPMDTLEQILGKYGQVNLVGKSFGVLKFKPKGSTEDIDVAIPRTDTATGAGGHKGIETKSDHTLPIEDDLKRRDLTINAIATDIEGNIIDPFGGVNDIKNKIIRMVDPSAFTEDPLRMLRAVQMASRFGFTIEPETMKAIQGSAVKIREIPSERILTEFDKIVQKGDHLVGANLLVETGIYKQLFGTNPVVNFNSEAELFRNAKTMGEFIYLLLDKTIDTPDEFFKTKLRGDINTYKEIKALKLAFDSKDDAANIYKARSVAYNMYAVYPESLKSDIIPMPVKIACDELLSGKYPKSNADLPVNGNDLMNLGFKGEQIKNKFKEILLKIYTDKLKNNREDIINYLNAGNSTDPNSGEAIPDATSENFNLHQVSESLEQEGVGDKYAEKKFGIPNSDNEYESKYNAHKQSTLEQPAAYVRSTNHVYNTRENVGIYKNPKSLSNFEPATRAIADYDGNIYVAQKNGSFVHENMAKALRIGGNDIYDHMDKFLLLNRVDNTNSFGLGDTSFSYMNAYKERRIEGLTIFKNLMKKNPQFKYYSNLFTNVSIDKDTSIKDDSVANEGVADKYAEKRFGIPDPEGEFNRKYNANQLAQTNTPVAFVDSTIYDYSADGHDKIEKVPIYKNPKSLANFEYNVRAVSDADGNLYVAQKNGNFVHGNIGQSLFFADSNYELYRNYDKYVLLHRMGELNSFGLSDSSEGYMRVNRAARADIDKLFDKLSTKNPQFKYYEQYYDGDGIDLNKPFDKNKLLPVTDEGVGDKYAEKRFGIPDPEKEFERDFKAHKQTQLEKPVAYVVDTERKGIPIYKNPKSLDNFDADVRAIGDPNGDLYVAGKNSWFVHGGMSEALGMFDNNYALYSEENLNRFSLLHRVGNTSSFGLGDAQVEILNDENANDGSIMANLRRIKSKSPQYKYYLDFYKDVTPQDKPIDEVLNRPEQTKPMSKKFIAYSAIVLDDRSKKKLYDSFASMLPEGFEFVGDHMTINFGEIDDFYKKYLGYTVRLKVDSYAMDDNTMAVGVSGFGSINDKRHITIGVNKSNGATAKMSNNLKNWITYRKPLFLIGSVKEIEFKI